MAAGGQMAEFFATLGFNINKADIQKVDKQLDILEARARRLSEQSLSNIRVNISRFSFSDGFDAKLRKSLEARMRAATRQSFKPELRFKKVHVPISGVKFDKDFNRELRNELEKRMAAATKKKFNVSHLKFTRVNIPITGFTFSKDFNTKLKTALQTKMRVASRSGVTPEIKLTKFDVDRNELLREMRDAVRYVEQNLRVNIRSNINRPGMGGGGGRSGGGTASNFAGGMGAGAAAGSLGRGFIPGLGVAFGVSQLNSINQELIGQDLASTAVFGSQEAGQEQMDWVRNLGNKIGFDYRSQANPYMKMAAAGKTAGMSTENVQGIFTGMAEYGRVMGLNDEDMKGSMRAVEQMLNKGQVYAEELKMQLGEKFPAAIQLMAEAVSGGDTEKLFKMMEQGEVSSIEYLPKFAKILSRQARVGGALTEAMKTSLAEQMRFNNTFNDMVQEFSKAGFEKGQAGIFRTMATFFRDMLPLIRGFGDAWKYVESILRVPLGLLADLSVGIEKLSEYSGMAKGDLIALGTVFGLLALPLTRMFTLISGALFVLEDFTAFLTGRGSIIGAFVEKIKENNPTEYLETVQSLKEAFESISELIDMIVEGWTLLLGLFSDQSAMSVILNTLTTAANEVKAAVDALLLLTGKKDPNKTDTHFGDNEGPVSYAVKGVTRLLKDPISTITPEQAKTYVRSDKVATLFNKMRDIKHIENMGYTDDMSKQQLQDYRAYKSNVETTERYLENTYNIQIDGTMDPLAVAREIERVVQEKQQEQLKGPSEKASGGSQ